MSSSNCCFLTCIHKFFQERNFVYIHTPIITGTDAEGAGEMFRATTLDLEDLPRTEDGQIDYSKDFFGQQTHLTVSGQLDVEPFAQAWRIQGTHGKISKTTRLLPTGNVSICSW